MPYRRPEDELAKGKKDWYRRHPDQDPQSTMSKVLEFVGLDEPYRNDSGSYDYRKQAWDESVAAGNPDMSWFLPELSGAQKYDLGSIYSGFTGDDDYVDPEVDHDPRTVAERNAGAVMDFLSWPLWGFEDEVLAGAMSALPGRGSYDDELALARAIRKDHDEYEPLFSARSVLSNGAGVLAGAGPLTAAIMAPYGAMRGARVAMGMAPEAVSTAGKVAQKVIPGAVSGGMVAPTIGFASREGGFDERMKGADTEALAGAIGGGLVFPALGYGAKLAWRGAKAAGRWARGRKVVGATKRKVPETEQVVTASAGRPDKMKFRSTEPTPIGPGATNAWDIEPVRTTIQKVLRKKR